MVLTEDQVDFFNQNGYLVIKDFVNEEAINQLKQEIHKVVETQYKGNEKHEFSTETRPQNEDDYFEKSSDKISFFEEAEVDPNNNTKKYQLNKIGHALHDKNQVFQNFSFQTPIKKILNQLQYDNPVIVQSMYIFKPPRIGGVVTPHQDATFLYTEENTKTVVGFWCALDDATKENGCLYGLPKSHLKGIEDRYTTQEGKKGLQMISWNKDIDYIKNDDQYKDQYVPLEVTKGSLVLLHGQFLHRSFKNESDKPREAYTFHVVNGVESYSKKNWLQRGDNFPVYWKNE